MTPAKHHLRSVLPRSHRSRLPAPEPKIIYRSPQISDDAQAVLGNVYNNYFYNRPGSHDNQDDTGASLVRTNDLSRVPLDTISDYDHHYAHWLRAQQRAPNTCNWFSHLAVYQDWVAQVGPPILVCVGSVGCGKSITASAMIDSLHQQRGSGVELVLSYYVDAARSSQTTTPEILRALIRQMLAYYRDLQIEPPADICSLIRCACLSIATAATTQDLTAVIQQFLRHKNTCFLVIDGIDALQENEILSLIAVLRILWPLNQTDLPGRLLLLCRETLGRRIRLESIPSSAIFRIELKHLEGDIQIYIDWEINKKQSELPITQNSAIIDLIKRTLKANCGKMFLWLHFQILSIWDPDMTTCDEDIKSQLNALPDGLDETYLRCLRRIDKTNGQRSREIAPKVFRWIACAQQPLTPAQAEEAVSMTPENLPLQDSQLLKSPVTDYCANLVVIDELTGTVRFPHSSVKDYLSDPNKIPSDLNYLRLSRTEDAIWCGEICLAYAKIHNARNQVVPFHTQEVHANIVTPILRNVLGNILPFRARTKPGKDNAPTFRLPVATISTPSTSMISDSTLHQYMCKHWLTHNAFIDDQLGLQFFDFKELCLKHDPDLQPWATTSIMNVEHYQRMVQYAVLNNNPVLLLVVHDYLEKTRMDYHESIFYAHVPGTGATYLHYASALGHVEVVKILLNIYPVGVADSSGMTAEAISVQAQQHKVLEVLIAASLLTPTLRQSQARLRWDTAEKEILLVVCVIHDNYEAAKILFKRDVKEQHLAAAFFTACRHGNTRMADLLVRHGADARIFDPSLLAGMYPNDLGNDRRPILRAALQLEDAKMMRTLLQVRRTFQISDHDCDLIHVFHHFSGRFVKSQPFVSLFLDFGLTIDKAKRNLESDSPLWWLQTLIDDRYDSHINRSSRWIGTDAELSRIVRMILQSSYSESAQSSSIRQCRNALPGNIEEENFSVWLYFATDDVLLRIMDLGWIAVEFLRSSACLKVAIERFSSRFLESVAMVLYQNDSCTPETPRNTRLSDLESSKESLMHLISHSVRSERLSTKPPALYPGVEQSLERQSGQFAEFLECYSSLQSTSLNHGEMYHAYDVDGSFARLMWMRCYRKANCDAGVTKQMCQELQRVGADGNFALNAPRGYGLTYMPFKSWMSGSTPKWILGVDIRIQLAVLRWNFRLNRARKGSFTESDWWYAALLICRYRRCMSEQVPDKTPREVEASFEEVSDSDLRVPRPTKQLYRRAWPRFLRTI